MKALVYVHLSRLTALTILSVTLFVSTTRIPTIIKVAGHTSEGIQFFTGTWKGLLAEAKRQNKPIFVDVYTTWCGPCQVMNKQAFPDKAVGELFNTSFVNYKLDAEKGEGVALAKRYAITGYPTSMYLDSDGRLIYRHTGYGNVKDFMAEANKAIRATREAQPISVWDSNYAKGKRDREFLKAYLSRRAALDLPNGNALNHYLALIPEADWTNDDNLLLVAGNMTTANSRVFDLVLLKADSVSYTRESGQINSRVVNALQNAVGMDRRNATTEAELEKSIQNARRIGGRMKHGPRPEEWWRTDMETNQRIEFYQRTNNTIRHREVATKRAQDLLSMSAETMKAMNAVNYQRALHEAGKLPDSVVHSVRFTRYLALKKSGEIDQLALKLNALARGYLESMTGVADLKQALAWSARALQADRMPMFLDTYAQLLGKLGRKDEAIAIEQEAIDKLKSGRESTEAYEKVLAQLKQ
jgi:thiol-disulfide isomerase/thioredoxin